MRIKIQGYWDAEVSSIEGINATPAEMLAKYGEVCVADILINGELVGTLYWDGKELRVEVVKKDEKSVS